MKTKDDKELQRLLDKFEGTLPADVDADTKVYQKLYEALGHPPTVLLSEDFATKVTTKAFRQRAWEEQRPPIALVVAVGLALLLSALTVYYTDAILLKTLVRRAWQIKEIIVFALAMLALVQLGDRWLVKRAR